MIKIKMMSMIMKLAMLAEPHWLVRGSLNKWPIDWTTDVLFVLVRQARRP